MNPNMDLFYVVISLIFVCELIVAIVLWVVDSTPPRPYIYERMEAPS